MGGSYLPRSGGSCLPQIFGRNGPVPRRAQDGGGATLMKETDLKAIRRCPRDVRRRRVDVYRQPGHQDAGRLARLRRYRRGGRRLDPDLGQGHAVRQPARQQKPSRWWAFEPDNEWDWLALVFLNVDDGTRQAYLVPRLWALDNSFPRPDGKRAINRRNNAELARFASNFALAPDPDAPARRTTQDGG